ncbi:MAG: GntR family transcriptional regulator [Pseudomonadota bacterium]
MRPPMAEPTRPLPNAAVAAERMRALIFSGELAAGTDHLESELADRLGMSRTPVREAIVILAAQGLLEVRPRRGVRVSPVSATDMAEVYDILIELESLAAAAAAAAGHDEAALGPINAAVAAMEHALAEGDLETWAELDDRFHGALVALGGNNRLTAIVAMMADQVRRARTATLHMRPLPLRSNEDHRAVVEAIERGDVDGARARHRAHMARAKEDLTGLLRKFRIAAL